MITQSFLAERRQELVAAGHIAMCGSVGDETFTYFTLPPSEFGQLPLVIDEAGFGLSIMGFHRKSRSADDITLIVVANNVPAQVRLLAAQAMVQRYVLREGIIKVSIDEIHFAKKLLPSTEWQAYFEIRCANLTRQIEQLEVSNPHWLQDLRDQRDLLATQIK